MLEPVVGANPTPKRIQAASTFEVTGLIQLTMCNPTLVTAGVSPQILTPLVHF